MRTLKILFLSVLICSTRQSLAQQFQFPTATGTSLPNLHYQSPATSASQSASTQPTTGLLDSNINSSTTNSINSYLTCPAGSHKYFSQAGAGLNASPDDIAKAPCVANDDVAGHSLGASGSSAGSQSGTLSGTTAYTKCPGSASHAKEVCTTGQAVAPAATQATRNLSGLATAQASGDALSACDAAGTASEMQAGINGTFAGLCDQAINQCAADCDTDGDPMSADVKATNAMATTCLGYKTSVYMAGSQAALSLVGLTQISACKQAAAATQCLQANAVNNSACPQQYCTLPAHTTDPVCQALANATSCANPANAGSAICQSQSAAALTAGTLPTTGLNAALASQDIPAIPVAAPLGNSQGAVVAPNAGGNSGGYASGLGNGGGAAAKVAGAGGDAKNPEVFLGSGNGSTAGMDQLGSHDYDPAMLARANGDTSMAGFNINKYLPKKAGLRAPASVDPNFLLKSGITSANGLSNWEKISKKLREKQPELRK